jgi:hypothetical protein
MSVSHEPLPTVVLLNERCADLKLKPADLVRRCGYKNITKGLRRLDEFRGCDFEASRGLIAALPNALGVPPEQLAEAIERTKQQLREASEKAWRAAFRPHAIIMTERNRPTSITLCVIVGSNRVRHIDFPEDLALGSYPHYAHDITKKRIEPRGGEILFFGKAIGFVVNYSPDSAVSFDLDGKPLATLDCAYQLGSMFISIGGHRFSPSEVDALAGRRAE